MTRAQGDGDRDTRPAPDAVEHESAARPRTGSEVLDDGQEEVFARRAVERGFVHDPKALAPEALARHPKSEVDLQDLSPPKGAAGGQASDAEPDAGATPQPH